MFLGKFTISFSTSFSFCVSFPSPAVASLLQIKHLQKICGCPQFSILIICKYIHFPVHLLPFRFFQWKIFKICVYSFLSEVIFISFCWNKLLSKYTEKQQPQIQMHQEYTLRRFVFLKICFPPLQTRYCAVAVAVSFSCQINVY